MNASTPAWQVRAWPAGQKNGCWTIATVVEDALETLDDNLPDSYLRKLTRVRSSADGQVMVHAEALALELLDAGHLPIDLDWVQQQIDCYQDLAILKIGDLWALPSLLALCVVEGSCWMPQKSSTNRTCQGRMIGGARDRERIGSRSDSGSGHQSAQYRGT